MRPLRLTAEGHAAVAGFLTRSLNEDHHRRLGRLLASFADGTWERRFWREPHPTEPDLLEIRPGERLHVFVSIHRTEPDLDEEVHIHQIVDSTHL
ncbi:hypothetical protein EDD29_2081 [Actinocorallia herbida]|uniref:MmyB-like transcription regulator ligand binding domain-containing protein n=1 Tax=Actinocorallia herbida TaxID=58109 RepID=A0A3N1CTQ7_9ACTN|nr:hypothetical protein [Actinocorallia herbida]ROO84554.1 hypothetical protein EDD29_2081 [Actinocorallia herbida]